MNSPIHFCTGYLAARALGYREHRFEALYVAAAAYAPDVDSLLSRFSPLFSHGIWTHTLAGVAVMSLIMASCTAAILAAFRITPRPKYGVLVGLALLGGVTHLFLDAFTYYESEADALHHLYFWPFWKFPWHINTVFPGVSYGVRIGVEVLYSLSVALYILGYQWFYRGQNPLRMFHPRNGFRETK
ncbi:MAG: metal-dependent hydrolase [Candidatus Hydrogenedentes bacterium]|nr:metal-dependent hydrolase [Candidatus Hydrogenedentota bacterium]